MQRAETLEAALPPLDEMVATVITDDEQGAFPREVTSLIQQHQIMEEIIPTAQGGRLTSIDALLGINRILSRRNLTSAIAIGQTFLGGLPVWIAGDDNQKERLAKIYRNGGLCCLALTEEAFGSDLQSNAVAITPLDDESYSLQGEKWCINNATKGDALSIFVRSHPAGGEQGFSMLFIDKSRLEQNRFSPIPEIKTHGLRGADISGIRFDNATVSSDAVLGRPGKGLAITLRTLQISRTLCAGFSLGAGDTCLRLATQFCLERQLYGANITALGRVRAMLAKNYRRLLFCEALALTMARACTLLPKQMSVYSAIVKYLAPVNIDHMITRCGVLLGARGYLREGPFALFQKMKRDHAVVSLFDGSTEVNLYVISGQLRSLLKDRPTPKKYSIAWKDLYDLSQPAPPFEGKGLILSNRGNDFIWEGLQALQQEPPAGLEEAIDRLMKKYRRLQQDYHQAADHFDQLSPQAFGFAERYCQITAQALYLQFWFYNKDQFGNEELRSEVWLDHMLTDFDTNIEDHWAFDALKDETENHRLYSHFYSPVTT